MGISILQLFTTKKKMSVVEKYVQIIIICGLQKKKNTKLKMFCKIVVKLFITDCIIKYIVNGVSALPIQIIASIILYICYFARGNSYMRLRIYIEQCIFLFYFIFRMFLFIWCLRRYHVLCVFNKYSYFTILIHK